MGLKQWNEGSRERAGTEDTYLYRLHDMPLSILWSLSLSSFADIPVPQKAVISNKKVTEIERSVL